MKTANPIKRLNKLSELLDRLAINFVSWRIKKGWGANCPIYDYEDFKDLPRELNSRERCGSCRAKEVVEWLDDWKEML